MGRAIYKPNLDRDEYLIWSTVVDVPVSRVMGRTEMREYWRTHCDPDYVLTVEAAEKSLARADKFGQSWQGWIPVETEELVRIGNIEGYDGDYEHGWCYLTDLADLARAIERRDWAAMEALMYDLKRWDDDEDEEVAW